jgi:NAD-dependent deacetylase
MNDNLKQAAEWVRSSKALLIFSGAGISAESGIPTFRDDGGFWDKFPPDYFATWNGLIKTAIARPKQLAEFVQAVIEPIATAQPNAAHIAIAEAEKYLPITVITQNIDGLHQEAGSKIVYEIHGSILEVKEISGNKISSITRKELKTISQGISKAKESYFTHLHLFRDLGKLIGINQRGIYHPNVVLFGDLLSEPARTLAWEAVVKTDCLIQIGCSGVVYPASSIPDLAKRGGAKVICIDPNETTGGLWLKGTATEIVPRLFDEAFE